VRLWRAHGLRPGRRIHSSGEWRYCGQPDAHESLLEIDAENATIRTEAGVVTAYLQTAWKNKDFFIPPIFQYSPFDHRRKYCLQRRGAALPVIRP